LTHFAARYLTPLGSQVLGQAADIEKDPLDLPQAGAGQDSAAAVIPQDVQGFDVYFPTRILESEPRTPKTFKSHRTTAITTTAFRIVLMEPAIGMNRLMSQRTTPTTIRTTTTWIKGII